MQGILNHESALVWVGLLSFFSLISILGEGIISTSVFTFVLLYTGMSDEKRKPYTIYFRRGKVNTCLLNRKLS